MEPHWPGRNISHIGTARNPQNTKCIVSVFSGFSDSCQQHHCLFCNKFQVVGVHLFSTLAENNTLFGHARSFVAAQHDSFVLNGGERMMKSLKRKPSSTKNEWEAVTEEDVEQGNEQPFHFSYGLSSMEAELLLKEHGMNALPEKVVPKWYTFIMLFCEPMPIMIWIAIIIEAILWKWMDMSILLAIQFSNASIAFYETTKSGDAVAALKASLKPEAVVKRDGVWRKMDAGLLVPGDMVMLSTGSAVPADCRINEGTVDIDQAALTGESLPVTMFQGDSCKMGSTVVRGEVEATVEFTGAKTFFGKTAALLQVS
jgi:magnesium-transporting ATPase (P-type)